MSVDAAAKAQATKVANQQTAGRITGFPNGTKVKVNTPLEKRYHSRSGVVGAHNAGEIGVDFGNNSLVWFYPHQLQK